MAQYEGGEEEASKINKGYKMNPGSRELDTPGNFAEGSPATNFLTDYYSQPTTELPGGGADAEEGAYSKGAVAEQADYSAVNKEIQGSIKEAGKGAGAAIQPKGDALTPERKSKLFNDAQGDPKKQKRLTEHYGQSWRTWNK